jgi:hypothetical protein
MLSHGSKVSTERWWYGDWHKIPQAWADFCCPRVTSGFPRIPRSTKYFNFLVVYGKTQEIYNNNNNNNNNNNILILVIRSKNEFRKPGAKYYYHRSKLQQK